MTRITGLSTAIAGAVCFAIGSALAASSAQAIAITQNFRVDITTGSLANQSFFGNFRYDDAALTDKSLEIIDPVNGNQIIDSSNGLLDLSFNFLGNTYTQTSDGGFPDFPQLNFQNGAFQALDFIVSESPFAPNPTVIPGLVFEFGTGFDATAGVPFFVALAGDPNAPDVSFGTVTYGVQAVPTPALLPGLIGMGIAALRKRKGEGAIEA